MTTSDEEPRPAWRLLSERPGGGRFRQVVTRRYAVAEGVEADWEVLVEPLAVAVLALTPERRAVLARQFRPGPGRVLAELPGGDIEAGEAPLEAAARELREETGVTAARIEAIGGCWTSTTSTQYRYVTVAYDCVVTAPQDDADRRTIAVTTVTLDELAAIARSGEMTDVDLVLLALDHLQDGA